MSQITNHDWKKKSVTFVLPVEGAVAAAPAEGVRLCVSLTTEVLKAVLDSDCVDIPEGRGT